MRRLQEKVDLFNQYKDKIEKKLQDSKDIEVKQTGTYQSVIKSLLMTIKGYQKYTDTVERSFVSSYENLLLMVDYKFESIRDAKKDIAKVDLDAKERKLLKTQSLSLLDVINEYVNPINYDELDKIFSKTVKDLRGRKFLDEKEASILFENVLGAANSSGPSNEPPSNQQSYFREKRHSILFRESVWSKKSIYSSSNLNPCRSCRCQPLRI